MGCANAPIGDTSVVLQTRFILVQVRNVRLCKPVSFSNDTQDLYALRAPEIQQYLELLLLRSPFSVLFGLLRPSIPAQARNVRLCKPVSFLFGSSLAGLSLCDLLDHTGEGGDRRLPASQQTGQQDLS